MADYPAITLISQIDTAIPADTEVVSKLPAADRQMKAMLKTFLAKAHDDDGDIKAGVIASGSFVAGAINGGTDIASASITADRLVAGTVTATQLGAGAVTATQLAANAVTTTKILDANVTHDKLSATAVDYDNIVANAVRVAAIKDGEITDAKMAAATLTNASIANNTITPVKIYASPAPTTAAPKLPVLAGADSVAASIGGVLTATLDTATKILTFAYSSASGTGASYARAHITATQAIAAGYNLLSWAAVTNGATIISLGNITTPAGYTGSGVNAKVIFATAGSYYIRVNIGGYGLGKFIPILATAVPASAAPTAATACGAGLASYAPYGYMDHACVHGVVTISNVATDFLYLVLLAELANATNGLGVASGFTSDTFATFEAIRF